MNRKGSRIKSVYPTVYANILKKAELEKWNFTAHNPPNLLSHTHHKPAHIYSIRYSTSSMLTLTGVDFTECRVFLTVPSWACAPWLSRNVSGMNQAEEALLQSVADSTTLCGNIL